ncbi:hypothetical protein [Sulfitobacter guttiformis]|uniref:Uncharacterized protein n=1 Tax=Sulfitobacter guttiformis TaxID=74349 RepID=A0A420DSW2_9RHOB|nr:hypothetical protein [Sulfitobacter guttiformis]KIN74675.1 hypothetical protein Z949_3874 [Sulfitobacter guttiformis KCTC 32187]RKE97250.1 hypothetical protein C8N30_1845 [Sulfitobacter guttiformis]
MSYIVNIRLAEPVQLDQVRLGTLYAQLGETGAGHVISRAMEELAVRLEQCETLWRASNRIQLRKHARSLIAISDQIGMHRLAQVARDVTDCIDAEDEVAIAATLSRMLRTGERSLSAIWAMEDLSI